MREILFRGFQFLIGSLQTEDKVEIAGPDWEFQFLIGSLQTCQ